MEGMKPALMTKEVGCKFCGRVIERLRVKKGGSTCFDCRQKQKIEYSRNARKSKAKKV